MTTFTPREVAAVLREFGIEDLGYFGAQPADENAESRRYGAYALAEGKQQAFVLRVMDPPPGADPPSYAQAFEEERALFEAGVPMPEPVRAPDGRGWIRFPSTGPYVSVERAVEGVPALEWIAGQPDRNKALREVAAQVGEAMSLMHSIPVFSKYEHHPIEREPRPDARWMAVVDKAKSVGAPWAGELERSLEVVFAAERIAETVDGREPTHRYSHNDLSPENVLVTETGDISIIRWELLEAAPVAHDFFAVSNQWQREAAEDRSISAGMLDSYVHAAGGARAPRAEVIAGALGHWTDQLHFVASIAVGDITEDVAGRRFEDDLYSLMDVIATPGDTTGLWPPTPNPEIDKVASSILRTLPMSIALAKEIRSLGPNDARGIGA